MCGQEDGGPSLLSSQSKDMVSHWEGQVSSTSHYPQLQVAETKFLESVAESCCLQTTLFRVKDSHMLKVQGWKKIFHANDNQKRSG